MIIVITTSWHESTGAPDQPGSKELSPLPHVLHPPGLADTYSCSLEERREALGGKLGGGAAYFQENALVIPHMKKFNNSTECSTRLEKEMIPKPSTPTP